MTNAQHWLNVWVQHETLNYNDDMPANSWELVFDTPGGNSLNRSFEACVAAARWWHCGSQRSQPWLVAHQRAVTEILFPDWVLYRPQPRPGRSWPYVKENESADRDRPAGPMVAQSFPFSQVNEAHAALEAGGFTGKIVLTSRTFNQALQTSSINSIQCLTGVCAPVSMCR